MPPKQNKSFNPLAPSKANKGTQKRKSKSKLELEKNYENFIKNDAENYSEEEPKPKMKRLKKLRKNSSSEEERFINKDNSEDQSWKSKDQEDFIEQKEESEVQQYQRYALADDQDIKAELEKPNKKKAKKNSKGNQEIDKFINKNKKNESKKSATKQIKKTNSEVQMNILSMLKGCAAKKQQSNPIKKKRKDSFDDQMDNIEIDDEISDISELGNYRLKQNKAEQEEEKISKTQQKQIEQAIRMSRVELEKQQQKIYESIKRQSSMEEQNNKKFQRKDTKNIKKKESVSKKKSKVKSDTEQKKGQLSGLQIVFTGQFEPYKKGRLVQLVMQLGAKNPQSITKKATHLFQGEFITDAYGRKIDQDPATTKKARDALQKGIPVIPNSELDNFFLTKTGKNLEQLIQKDKNKMIQRKLTDQKFMDIEKTGVKTINVNEESQQNGEKQTLLNKTKDNSLWTEKYKPKSLNQIVGQKSQVSQLRQWIEAWEDIQLHGNKRQVKGGYNSFMPAGNINSKAALLSGDAGLGKTSTARLLAMQYNYGVVQYNASSSRSKKSVISMSDGKDNLWLGDNASYAKTIIIMDEIDGMSSGDRGGITAIIEMIKKTRVPIICICNDRQSQKIKSLAGHCYDIKFHKPNKDMIVKRIETILDHEGGRYTSKGIERIVQMMQNDMRQVITYIQFFFKTVGRQITYDTVQKHPGQKKDNAVTINHFEASKRLMNRLSFQNMTISQRTDLAFVDSDFVPLMIFENYLGTGIKKKMNRSEFHNVVKATQSLVMGDLVERKIMRTQNYAVMPNKMFLTSVYPTQMVSQSCGFVKFTSWLGKFSSQRKNKRLIKQLKHFLAIQSLVSTHSVKHNYSSMIFQWIVNNLKGSEPNINRIIEFMQFYNINPTILSENIAVLQLGSRSDQLKNISASVKTKLTKAYNAHHQKIGDKKKGKKTTNESIGTGKYNPILGEIEIDSFEEEESDNQISEEKEGIVLKKGKSKGNKK